MKKQITILKTLIQAAVVLVATAVASPAAAAIEAYGDINNDGLMDVAVLTSPTTVTVYLANPDGSYTVSAMLSVPKSQHFANFGFLDLDGDGDLDVSATGVAGGGQFYWHTWSGNGDGTFSSRSTYKPRGKGIW
jgi:hypothetical protein